MKNYKYNAATLGDGNQEVNKYGLTHARITFANTDEETYEDKIVKFDAATNTISFSDGFHLCPPVLPDAADFETPAHVILYGKGIGFAVRGMKINGTLIYYKTEAETLQEHNDETYGADLAEYLARWDASKNVWSISMGGIGPGYEQAIQTLYIEMLRDVHKRWPELGSIDLSDEAIKAEFNQITDAVATVCDKAEWAGFSGAQVDAARSLAFHVGHKGIQAVMEDPQVKDRHILISNMHKYVRAAEPATEQGA